MESDSIGSASTTMSNLLDAGVTMRIVNVMAHMNLCTTIDVKHLALNARNAEYHPRGFNAVVIRFRTPQATALVYRSGSAIVTGAKSPENAQLAATKLESMLKSIGFECTLSRFTIGNIAISGDFGFNLRLEGLASDHARFCSYEPELFPGLVYRMLQDKVTFLLFVSGKFVITGCRELERAREALCDIYPVVQQYRFTRLVVDDSMEL